MNLNLSRARVMSVILAVFVFSARANGETNQPAAKPLAGEATPTEKAPSGAPAPAALEDMSKEDMIKLLKELSGELRNVRQELNQIETERAAEAEQKAKAAGARPPVAMPAAQPAVPAPQPAVPLQTPGQVAENKEQADIERQRAIRSVTRNSVLVPKGAIEVEPAVTYTHASSNLINIEGFAILPVLVLGQIESLRIERDIVLPAMTVRYGLLSRLQIDGTAYYRYERDRYVRQVENQPRLTQTVRDDGLADTQFGLTYQLFYENGLIPDTTLTARVTAPTGKSQFDINSTNAIPNELALGSGVWSVRSGITTIKAIDPAVIIFNCGYTVSTGHDFTVQQSASTNEISGTVTNPVNFTIPVHTTFEPGDAFDYGVAIALALNPVLAVNLQFHQTITFDTSLKGFGNVEGSSSNTADIRFGFAWAIARNATVDFSAAAGLTEDTPDMAVQLAIPIRF